jgi:glycosyltransferase involved in cell wall biosynthesis
MYNAASFIAETVESIRTQTYTDWHLYLVDDHSSDTTATVCGELCALDTRISYHLTTKPGGCPAPTKNAGTLLATEPYIAYCDHDDWWFPEKLAKQVAYLKDHPEVNLLGSNVEIYDSSKKQSLGMFWSNPSNFSSATARSLVLDGPVFATTSCIIARTKFMQSHLFDERFIGSDEYDLCLHSILDNPHQVALLPETLCRWRWHSGSLSHSDQAATRALSDETQFAEKILARADLSDPERHQILSRLSMVQRRAANAALIAKSYPEARELYRQAQSYDILSRIFLLLSTIAPALLRVLLKYKKQYSHANPTFR